MLRLGVSFVLLRLIFKQIIFDLQPNPGDGTNKSLRAFGIYADTGWLYLRKSVDREAVPEYSFVATVRDNGQPRRSSKAKVSVKILDVNDNPPQCNGNVQEFVIEENRPIGSKVGNVYATDPDQGANGTVRYRLEESETEAFQVTVQGSIVATQVLDFETKDVHHFSIIAYDGGQPPLSSQCKVKIQVLDVNDNAPFFILPAHSGPIYFREEQSIDTEVFQVQAKDMDQGRNGTVTYRMGGAHSSAALPFRINAKTGIVYSTAILDYEQGMVTFKLTIIAQDMGSPSLSAEKVFTVELVDVDDGSKLPEADEDDSNVITFELSEMAPVGTLLGSVDQQRSLDIAAVKYDDEEPALEKLMDVSYTITSGNSMAIFDVDHFSGTLFTVKRLDFETANFHFLTLSKVNASNKAATQVKHISVKIKVVDENDNSPQFPEDPVVFSLPENTPVGSEVWLYNATDADTGKYGRIKYRLLDGSGEVFSVDPIRGALLLRSPLDHENCTEYMVIVEATDQAASPVDRRSTQVTTRIYVVDINDNAPKIISNDTMYIYENAPTDYPLFYVIATDEDWLENGRITYSIKENNINNKFSINSTTGAVVLNSRLNNDNPGEYRFTLVASDHGVPPLTGSQVLRVKVVPVRSDLPRFEKSVYFTKVAENGPPGTKVVQVKASKRVAAKGPKDDALLYELLPGNSQGSFVIDKFTGLVTTAVPLDREEEREARLVVMAQSSNFPEQYDTTVVVITVEDVNDNRPTINKDSCHQLTIPENVKVQNLVNIYASDPDDNLNGRLAYSIIEGNESGKFRINAQTGRLSCDSLDRETTAIYNLTILVTDSGWPRLSDTCNLTISVTDENDNKPTFDKDKHTVDVRENVAPGSTILRLHAEDLDEGHNGRVTYSIANNTNGIFDVKLNTGELVILRPLDYELRREHVFYVMASDEGAASQLVDFTQIHVNVIDVNDNAPTLLKHPFEAAVPSLIAAGQRVIKITATDADGPGPNSELGYSLLEEHRTNFNINPKTGVISAKGKTQIAEGTIEYLKVAVSDAGQPPLRSVGVVKIFVQGTTNEWVKCERDLYHFTISDSYAKIGTVKANVKSDAVVGMNKVMYTIVAGNEEAFFNIEPETGALKLAKDAMQRMAGDNVKHQLLVMATLNSHDHFVNNSRAICSVHLQRYTRSSHTPYFLQRVYSVAIPEGQAKGFYVLQVSAVDLDTAGRNKLTYGFLSGNVDSAFSIDQNGTIRTQVELDREIKDRYELTVSATDFVNFGTSGHAIVHITVLDVNDNSPSFPPARPVSIAEDASVGSYVAIATANDVDSYPPLEYSFTSDGNAGKLFAISRFSGRVSLAKGLDFEMQKSHTLTIRVTDRRHSAYTKLFVSVLDVNDNAPAFRKPLYQISLPLGTLRGTSLARISARDKDAQHNGRLTYQLLDDQQRADFKVTPQCWVEPNSGTLYLNETLSRLDKYATVSKLTLEASDYGNPPKVSRVPVILQLLPATSMEKIRFAHPMFSFTVPENYPVHTVIGQLDVLQPPDQSSQVSYVLSGEDETSTKERMFEVDPMGRLVLLGALDREKQEEHRFKATIYSNVHSASNSSTAVLVKVDDVNDNRPSFSQHKYGASVDDSAPLGTMVLKLTATDRDVGQNAKLTFAITSGNTGNAFTIDSNTGVIKVNRRLSAMAVEDYKLIVKATDSGTPPLSALAMCLITVRIQRPQGGPFFPVGLYLGNIAENAPAGSLVFTVKAATDDSKSAKGKNAKRRMFYSIKAFEEEDDGWQYFVVDRNNGQVRTKIAFDYEQQTSYKFTVVVTDSIGNEHSVPCQVLIKGVDEFSPVFSESRYIVETAIGAIRGQRIGVIYAKDYDAGIDGQVTYKIKEPNDYFDINPNTGVVFLKQDLTDALCDLYESLPYKGKSADSATEMVFAFTIVACSGLDPAELKCNSTTLEVQVLPKRALEMSIGFTLLIIVAVLLLMLCCCAACTLVTQRRKRPQVQSSLKSVSYPKQNRQKLNSTSSKCALLKGTLSRNGVQRNGSVHSLFGSVDLTNHDEKRAPVLSSFDLKRPLKSVSDYSVKSSGRGSYESDSAPTGDHALHLSSEHDSTMQSWLYDEPPPMGSEKSASTHEYLTNLGIDSTTRAGLRLQDTLTCAKPPLPASFNAHEDGINLQQLIYSKVDEVLSSSTLDRQSDKFRLTNATNLPVPNQSVNRSVPLDDLLPPNSWGPAFQPVTSVLSEITRINSAQRPKQHSTEDLASIKDPWVKRADLQGSTSKGYHTLPRLPSETRTTARTKSEGQNGRNS